MTAAPTDDHNQPKPAETVRDNKSRFCLSILSQHPKSLLTCEKRLKGIKRAKTPNLLWMLLMQDDDLSWRTSSAARPGQWQRARLEDSRSPPGIVGSAASCCLMEGKAREDRRCRRSYSSRKRHTVLHRPVTVATLRTKSGTAAKDNAGFDCEHSILETSTMKNENHH